MKTYVNASNLKLYLSPNEGKEKDNGYLPDLVHAQDLPPLPDTVDELLKSIQYEKSRHKSKGLKRELPNMDILFPGPESSRKEKKKKPNSDENTSPTSDNTYHTAPPSQAEQDWKVSQVKIIKPVPLTAQTPDETSLSTSPSSRKSSTTEPPQTKSKIFSKNGGILKKQKDAFLDKMVSECAVDPKKDEDNDIQVVSTDDKHMEFLFKPLTKEQKIKICKWTSLIYRKDIKNNSSGDKLGNRTPIIRQMKGDRNSFFRAMSVSVTGWEV